MSILLHPEIISYYKDGLIHINPYDEKCVQPNSYDVHLSGILKRYVNHNLDSKKINETYDIEIHKEGYELQPGVLYLGSTIEEIGSDYFVSMYEGVSSAARLGISSHLSAGFGDIGFKSKWTLEITVVQPVKVYPGQRIGQICFHRVGNAAFNINYQHRYNGKYSDQSKGPVASKAYQDVKLNCD